MIGEHTLGSLATLGTLKAANVDMLAVRGNSVILDVLAREAIRVRLECSESGRKCRDVIFGK